MSLSFGEVLVLGCWGVSMSRGKFPGAVGGDAGRRGRHLRMYRFRGIVGYV